MKDLKINNGNLVIENGDFATIEGDDAMLQRAGLIIESNQGEWKEHLLLGCNLLQLKNGKAGGTEIRRRIRLQLLSDNIDFNRIKTQLDV